MLINLFFFLYRLLDFFFVHHLLEYYLSLCSVLLCVCVTIHEETPAVSSEEAEELLG